LLAAKALRFILAVAVLIADPRFFAMLSPACRRIFKQVFPRLGRILYKIFANFFSEPALIKGVKSRLQILNQEYGCAWTMA